MADLSSEETSKRSLALYCRVSTDEQAREGVSLDEQQERLKAYCQAMGWRTGISLYIDDGYSAKSMDRPELKRLLKDVHDGRIAKVMVTKLDRISRKLLDLLNLIDVFQEFGVSFVSISESFDTHTPSGRLTLQVLGAVAEFERERIRERVFENMHHAAGMGKWLTQSPYGYRLEDKCLVVHEAEAKNVRRLYDLFLHEGKGYYALAKIFNEEGITSKYGKQWSVRSVKRVLTNPVYKGTLVWNRTDSSKKKRDEKNAEDWVVVENCLPAIVDKRAWEEVQGRANRGTVAPRAQTSPHLLGGMLRCGNCGSGMSIGYSGSPGNRYRVYRCSANKNKGTCTSKQYRANEVESWFKYGLSQLSGNREQCFELVRPPLTEKDVNGNKYNKIRSAKARYKRKIEAYAAGLIELADLDQEKRRMEAVLSECEQSEEEKHYRLDEVASKIHKKINRSITALDILPVEAGKHLLQSFIAEVIIHGDKNIEIVFFKNNYKKG